MAAPMMFDLPIVLPDDITPALALTAEAPAVRRAEVTSSSPA
jgi:hypothetical protein